MTTSESFECSDWGPWPRTTFGPLGSWSLRSRDQIQLLMVCTGPGYTQNPVTGVQRGLIDNTLHRFPSIIAWEIEFAPRRCPMLGGWLMSDVLWPSRHTPCAFADLILCLFSEVTCELLSSVSPWKKSLSLGEPWGSWHTWPSRHWQLVVTLMTDVIKQLSGGVTQHHCFPLIMLWESLEKDASAKPYTCLA